MLVLRACQNAIWWPLDCANSLHMMVAIVNCLLLVVVVDFERTIRVAQSDLVLEWTAFEGSEVLPTESNGKFPTQSRLELVIDNHIIEVEVIHIPSTDKIAVGPVQKVGVVVVPPSKHLELSEGNCFLASEEIQLQSISSPSILLDGFVQGETANWFTLVIGKNGIWEIALIRLHTVTPGSLLGLLLLLSSERRLREQESIIPLIFALARAGGLPLSIGDTFLIKVPFDTLPHASIFCI